MGGKGSCVGALLLISVATGVGSAITLDVHAKVVGAGFEDEEVDEEFDDALT